MAKRKIKEGDIVKVNYTGKLKNGEIFDSSEGKEPLHFIIGQNEVIPGFEEAIKGMTEGEQKTFTVGYPQAYGPRQKEKIETIDLKMLPEGLDLRVGGQLELTLESGHILKAMITELTDSTVTLDRNHLLAGKDLIFDVEVLEVEKAPKNPVSPPPVPPTQSK